MESGLTTTPALLRTGPRMGVASSYRFISGYLVARLKDYSQPWCLLENSVTSAKSVNCSSGMRGHREQV